MDKQIIKSITYEMPKVFRCFGGGQSTVGNPVAEALKNEPPQFAAGVDVESVVTYVVERYKQSQSD